MATWSVDGLLALTQNTVFPKELQAGVNERDYHITNTRKSSSIQILCSIPIITIRHLILQHIVFNLWLWTPENPRMILQRLIKQSESIVNGPKPAPWGSTQSLQRFFNKEKERFLQTFTAQRVRSPRWIFLALSPSPADSTPCTVPMHTDQLGIWWPPSMLTYQIVSLFLLDHWPLPETQSSEVWVWLLPSIAAHRACQQSWKTPSQLQKCLLGTK